MKAIVIKKKTILLIAAAAAAVILLVGVSVAVAVAAESEPETGKIIVVDAGHGGFDGGVIGRTSGVKESDINLAISKALQSFLKNNGYRVVMTRENSDGLYGLAKSNRKIRDMEARKAIIEEAKPDLVVSIHQNSFPSGTAKGPQVFYAPNSETGASYATTAQNTLNSNLGGTRVPKAGDFYILQCSPAPSLLVECGFFSNTEEEKLLVTSEYQQKVAFAVYSAIHTILAEPSPCT